MVEELLNAGINPNLPSATGGDTALLWLIGSSGYQCNNNTSARATIAKLLLERGADPNVHTPLTVAQLSDNVPGPGTTPLYEAIRNGCVEIVKVLVANGADKNAIVYGASVLNAFESNRIPFGIVPDGVKKDIATALAH